MRGKRFAFRVNKMWMIRICDILYAKHGIFRWSCEIFVVIVIFCTYKHIHIFLLSCVRIWIRQSRARKIKPFCVIYLQMYAQQWRWFRMIRSKWQSHDVWLLSSRRKIDEDGLKYLNNNMVNNFRLDTQNVHKQKFTAENIEISIYMVAKERKGAFYTIWICVA